MTTHPPQPQRQPREDNLIPFPRGGSDPVLNGELLSEQENAAVVARLSGRGRLPARVAVLARVVSDSPRTARLLAVAAYRMRQLPRDTARLCWFFLRGNAR